MKVSSNHKVGYDYYYSPSSSYDLHFILAGVSVNEFFDILQEKTNADKDSSEAFFAQMLLAVTEFDVFIMMMKEAAQAQNPYDPEAAAKVLEDESNSRK